MIIAALIFLFLILLLPLRLNISADGTEKIRLCIFYWKIPIKRLALIIKLRAGIVPNVYLENKKVCVCVFPKKTRKNHRRIPLLHAVLWAYRIDKLHMNIIIGTEDAALTAYFVGLVNLLMCMLLPKLHFKALEKVHVCVLPHFDGRYFSAKGECIISALPADIIRKAIIRKADNNHASH